MIEDNYSDDEKPVNQQPNQSKSAIPQGKKPLVTLKVVPGGSSNPKLQTLATVKTIDKASTSVEKPVSSKFELVKDEDDYEDDYEEDAKDLEEFRQSALQY